MQHGLGCWRTDAIWAGLLATGLLVAVIGCRGGKSGPAVRGGRAAGTATPAALAEKAAAVIAAVCTRQSYATAKVGLIAGETGLREDVFELRDPVSYRVVPYRLGATLRLEGLLRQGAQAVGRPGSQAECMSQFANHLKALSDPLAQAARDEKEIDASAFQDSERQAEQQMEMEDQKMKR